MKSKLTIDRHSTKIWRLPNGSLHREDRPALEYNNGDKSWYINGKCHREDGPAVELIGGYKAWYINGLRHREDGPSIEWEDGNKTWYLNDIRCTEKEHKSMLRSIKLKLLL
jgi:hypothetical protein